MANGKTGAASKDVFLLFREGSVGRRTDGQLLGRYLTGRGDPATDAFEELVRRHGPMVLGVCRRILSDPADTEDAFQATFLLLARKARSIRGRDALGGWLYGVARRVAVRARQDDRRRLEHHRRLAGLVRLADPPDRPGLDDRDALHEEVERLPPRLRDPVVLCYWQGMTQEVAAQTLGVTETTVRGRLARARALLRSRLTRRGIAAETALSPAIWPGIDPAVPAGWSEAAARAAAGFLSGGPISGAASASVGALVEGVSRTMIASNLKSTVLIASVLGGLGLAGVVLAQQKPEAARSPEVAQPEAGNGQKPETPGDELARAVDGRIVSSRELARDCMILSYLPDWAFGNVDNIGVANNDGGVRTLAAWPDLSKSVAVQPELRFFLAFYSRKTDSGEKPGSLLAFEPSSEWPERTSWRTKPSYEPEPVGSYPFQPGKGWKVFEITTLVRKGQGKGDRGVLLRFQSEDRTGGGAWSGYQFVSREGAGEWAGLRPRLLVVKPSKE